MGIEYNKMAEAFADLADVIGNNIWWYQGGADAALRALLKEREKLLLLLGESVKNVEVKESSKGKYTVTVSRFERDRIAKLLVDEYNRVLALPVDESIGFPVSAKVASLIDAREMAEAFGATIDD